MQLLRSSLLLLLPFVVANPIPQEDSDIIPGQYIITLKDGLSQADVESHKTWVSSVHRSNLAATGRQGIQSGGIAKAFQIHDLNVYSGNFDEQTAEDIRRSPYVKSVTPDRKVYLAETVTQEDAIWNLGHMSSKGQPSTTYKYDSAAGEGVWAYVLDTGIHISHEEFEGRAILGYNAVKNTPHEDRNGHVAKKATVVSAKAFDTGSSSYTYIFDAYNWIVKNITESRRQTKSVVNMSISSAKYQPFDDAVERAYRAGVVTVAAAGNDGRDASRNTPASARNAITVGAFRADNTRSTFSNYGRVVDIFAPGELIKSSWPSPTNNLTNIASGTSAAAPHVVGLVAYLMSLETFTSPAAVARRVIQLAIPNLVKNPGTGSPNRLAYNGIQERR
ncbi:hypothetical protein UREG_03282 [Uncinocarpus reesii 1704]|uniref:Uncharacterized protein n=1 Tax=Uncinocarpus reesii (strain UAMH 1704) TaxID=336963 RepID=C4JQ49_UNCRE|nr:uncharacterized protein UREG_03282 [Uncinocarpus reesii 1704]EEP78436.1 hypothetical protein UREG_03282 [Uncinocarpus reesii 1704]